MTSHKSSQGFHPCTISSKDSKAGGSTAQTCGQPDAIVSHFALLLLQLFSSLYVGGMRCENVIKILQYSSNVGCGACNKYLNQLRIGYKHVAWSGLCSPTLTVQIRTADTLS